MHGRAMRPVMGSARSVSAGDGSSTSGMKTLIVIVSIVLVMPPPGARAAIDESAHGARSRAMGGTFVSLGDDASTLFINAAGLVIAEEISLYGDNAEPCEAEISSTVKGCVVVPAWGVAAGMGWYRLGRTDGTTENLFVAGVARTILRERISA